MARIPKIIHYCWFGGNPLSRETKRYIRSWKKYCPDYEIRQWDESNFDVSCNTYVREAYEAKKWAFVTDYVRLWALNEFGGVYMDTDVELLRPIDRFLEHTAFSGFENEGFIPTAIMGSVPGGEWVRLLLRDYDDRHFLLPDGSYDLTTNVITITNVTKAHYDLRLDNTYQEVGDALTLYPKDYFCPKSYSTGIITLTANTHSIHHFAGSWLEGDARRDLETQKRCIRLLGPRLGSELGRSLNLMRRHDGSYRRQVVKDLRYYIWRSALAFFRILPVSDRILVFETEGDFCDNGRAFYEYLLSSGKAENYTIAWLVSAPENFRDRETKNVRFFTRDSLWGRYYINRARYIFFTHPYWLKKWKKGQTVVDFGHGMAFKGAGNDLHDTFDYLCITSQETAELYTKFFNSQPEQMLPLGVPRLDLLFREKDVRPFLTGCLPDVTYDRLVLCMPTFRQTAAWTDGDFRNTYSINPVHTAAELEALNAFLRERNILLVAKIHHLQTTDFLKTTSLTNILYLTDAELMAADIQLYEFVAQADALLTDYSSIYFDYLLLDRPIGFFIEDMDQYSRGFVVDDPLAWMPGEKIRDLDGLYSFLDHLRNGVDRHAAERRALLEKVDCHRDGENCRRIAEHFGI